MNPCVLHYDTALTLTCTYDWRTSLCTQGRGRWCTTADWAGQWRRGLHRGQRRQDHLAGTLVLAGGYSGHSTAIFLPTRFALFSFLLYRFSLPFIPFSWPRTTMMYSRVTTIVWRCRPAPGAAPASGPHPSPTCATARRRASGAWRHRCAALRHHWTRSTMRCPRQVSVLVTSNLLMIYMYLAKAYTVALVCFNYIA